MARVLLIDDSPFQQAWMTALLKRAGHQTVAVSSGCEAIALSGASADGVESVFDACFIELILRRENGFELSTLDVLAGIPVVLMLARRQEADLAWAQALGVRHFLYRPCRHEILEALLQEILAGTAP